MSGHAAGATRVGQGVDVHAFAGEGDGPLVLGGVTFPGERGLAGHSDGDVVLHALVDALLGAAALGDIGALFGSADPRYAGAGSDVFVSGAVAAVREAGWRPLNADLTVVGARPRIAPRRERMRARVADLLGLEPAAVSVKATTTDGLGLTGRGEGLACFAIVLIGLETD